MKKSLRLPFLLLMFIIYVGWIVLASNISLTSLLYPFVFAPLVEELVFRYAVLEICLRSKKLKPIIYMVVIITSFIFGAIHWHQNMFLFQGVLGFFLAHIYIKTRNYWYIVIFHSAWNIFVHYGLGYLI